MERLGRAALLAACLAAPARAGEPALMAAMRERLGWPGPASASAEQRALDAALARLLATPTGEALGRQFVAEGHRATVEFADLPGELVEYEGKLELVGETATTNGRAWPPRVSLNRLYLREDSSLRDVDLSATLAHELFGHAMEAQRASRAGVPFHVFSFYAGDELNGRLIGWLVRLELGAALADEAMELHLRDPAAYVRRSYAQSSTYAVALTRQEMRDPLRAVRERIATLDAARDANEAAPESGYRSLMRERIAQSREAVARQIEMWLHRSGTDPIRAAADHPHLVELDAVIARRAEAVRVRAAAPAAR